MMRSLDYQHMGTTVNFYNFVTDGTETPTSVAGQLVPRPTGFTCIFACICQKTKKKKNYRKCEEIEKLGSAWPGTAT